MDQANGRTEGWDTGAVSVVFCSDERLLEVNNKYLNHNYFTDIITFDYSDPEKKKIAGDLMIGIGTVRDNAAAFGTTFENELQRVIIHGILHLVRLRRQNARRSRTDEKSGKQIPGPVLQRNPRVRAASGRQEAERGAGKTKKMKFEYDIIVVGGGHAGCEAAAAAANMGCRTLLITMDMGKFAQMSCNPAVGGVAKGQIVREIDAMGGYTGIVTDRTTLQFRMLNRSKGPAMWSPRAQCDKARFSLLWREMLENTQNLYLWQDAVTALQIEQNTVAGVTTRMGVQFRSKAVILTAGTFLEGLMHIGRTHVPGGRAGDPASHG